MNNNLFHALDVNLKTQDLKQLIATSQPQHN
jgi:hypothetical protein